VRKECIEIENKDESEFIESISRGPKNALYAKEIGKVKNSVP
jgi:hypothetical protein